MTREAPGLAESDPEWQEWLAAHGARQAVLREKFRQIAVPAGRGEQIVSERSADQKGIIWRPGFALAAAAVFLLLGTLIFFRFPKPAADDTLVVYQNRMAGVAWRGYGMDLMANDPAKIRAYLAQNHAPADFVLPGTRPQTALAGGAVEGWQSAKVSLICFRTAQSVAAGGRSDLWLFVVDRAFVKGAAGDAWPQFSRVNRLITATWTQDGKRYFLGTEGDEQTIKQYL